MREFPYQITGEGAKMKTYHILAIGNSFSEDAAQYIHQAALAVGIQATIVNLYIGGCSLERHWINIEKNSPAYQYQINGEKTSRQASINEVLREESWDFIVTQQASFDSGWSDTYEPFLGLLIAYLREEAPNAELFLQQTWAYEPDSGHENFMRYHRDQKEMYERLTACYTQKAREYRLGLIPCGAVIQELRKSKIFDVGENGMSICRDGHHMSYIYGRYALACVWIKTLFHANIKEMSYVPYTEMEPETIADEGILRLIRETAADLPSIDS